LGALALFACESSTPSTPPPPSSNPDAAVSQPDAAPIADAGVPDAGAEIPEPCKSLGLEARPFQAPSTTFAFGDVAGDFTVDTLFAGPFNLAAEWTGCESYTFLNYIPTRGSFEEQLWSSNAELLVRDTPKNAHFFFVSWENDQTARRDRVSTILGYIDSFIEITYADPVEREAQRRRFHYVTTRGPDVAGSVGGFIADYSSFSQDPANAVDLGSRGIAAPPTPFVFAIDRDQQWDSGGNLNEVVGGAPSFKMASYLPAFFDHKASLRDAQASESGVETFVLLDESVTSRVFTRTATLPDAAAMAAYDTLEFDVSVRCPYRNVFACSEWDRIARIELCLTADCSDRRELVRWITPYWRRGERRWVMDASSLFGLVSQGGLHYFRIVTGPGWERATERHVRVALRLRSAGGPRGAGAVRAFTGGNFNADYNTRDPFEVTVPASASKAELVLILSGHGQDMRTNCAEWCDHRHRFTVNGTALPEVRHEGNVGSRDGCGPAAADGAPPGQWGNWAPERAYWCPGLPVDHIRLDITDHLTRTATNTITYSANLAGGAPGGGNIDLSAYVAWFE